MWFVQLGKREKDFFILSFPSLQIVKSVGEENMIFDIQLDRIQKASMDNTRKKSL